MFCGLYIHAKIRIMYSTSEHQVRIYLQETIYLQMIYLYISFSLKVRTVCILIRNKKATHIYGDRAVFGAEDYSRIG